MNLLAVSGFFMMLAAPSHASEVGTPAHKFGLGLVVGSPTGLTGKFYPSGRRTAVEATLAISPGYRGAPGGGLYAHGVYMWHPSLLTDEPSFELPWHVGIGGFIADDYATPWRDWTGGTAIGARGTLGMDFDLEDIRLQISGDIALNLGFHSTWGFYYEPSLGVAVRYFF